MTAHLLPPDRSPEAMTRRARVILIGEFLANGLIGITILAFPWLYQSVAWVYIDQTPGLAFWGCAFIAASLVCGWAAFTRHADWARVGLLGSGVLAAVICAGVASSFIVELDSEKPFSPLIPILLAMLVLFDFVMGAQPIRTPFESILRRFRG